MVNLAKIRKKAKEKEKASAPAKENGAPASAGKPEARRPPAEAGAPSVVAETTPAPSIQHTAPVSKLERFKQEAGKRREVKRVVEDVSADEQLEALTFIIAGEHYAVDIEKIVEIVTPRPVTRIPNADPFIVGIISLRGAVVTVLDLRRRLNHPPAAGPSEDRRVVVVDHVGETVGFEVDRVLRVVSVGRSAIEPQPVAHPMEQDESVRGVFRVSNSLTILLDLDKLLTTASMLPAS